MLGHCADLTALLPALASFRPTFILAVPRVFEKVYNGAEQKAVSEQRGAIFGRAARVAIAYSQALDAPSGRPAFGLRAQHALFDRLVYGKLRAALGGRAHYAVSGGAALSERLCHFFRGIGVTVLEGYGLTETTAAATVNRPDRNKIGTVGQPLPGVAIKIAEDGEILISGANVFPRLLAERGGHQGDLRRGRLVPHRRHRRARRRGLPDHHRAEEGDDRHRRRQERRARGARGPAPQPRPDQPGHGGRRRQAVHRRADHAGRRGARAVEGKARQARRRHASRRCAKTPISSRPCRRRSTTPTRRCPGRSRSGSSGSWTSTSPRRAGQLTVKLGIRRSVLMKDFAADVEALYS